MTYSSHQLAAEVSRRPGHPISHDTIGRWSVEGLLPLRARGHGRPAVYTEADVERAVALARLRQGGRHFNRFAARSCRH